MSVFQQSRTSPRGLSFGIADLILLRSWAEARDLHMTVHLDYGVEGEEYEEVLAFSKGASQPCLWIMWRNAELVFVQPLIGRRQRYSAVADIIEALTPEQKAAPTDIKATHWPAWRSTGKRS